MIQQQSHEGKPLLSALAHDHEPVWSTKVALNHTNTWQLASLV